MTSWQSAVSALGSRTGMRRVLVAYALYGLLEFYVWLVVVLWAYGVGGATLAGLAAPVLARGGGRARLPWRGTSPRSERP